MTAGTLPLSGLGAADVVFGLDWRPDTGGFVLLTRTAAGLAKVHRLDVATGVVSNPVTLFNHPDDTSTPYSALTAEAGGIDVNPQPDPDLLRVVGTNDQNLRVNMDTGATTTDVPLSPGSKQISGAAYDSPRSDPTLEQLYDFAFADNRFYFQNPPNSGTLVDLGPWGFTAEGTPASAHVDISLDGDKFLAARVGDDQTLWRFLPTEPQGSISMDPVLGMAAVNNVVRIASGPVRARSPARRGSRSSATPRSTRPTSRSPSR